MKQGISRVLRYSDIGVCGGGFRQEREDSKGEAPLRTQSWGAVTSRFENLDIFNREGRQATPRRVFASSIHTTLNKKKKFKKQETRGVAAGAVKDQNEKIFWDAHVAQKQVRIV